MCLPDMAMTLSDLRRVDRLKNRVSRILVSTCSVGSSGADVLAFRFLANPDHVPPELGQKAVTYAFGPGKSLLTSAWSTLTRTWRTRVAPKTGLYRIQNSLNPGEEH